MVKRALLLTALAGCRLTDVLVLPPGDPVVQVQAVLDPTRTLQTVLVQRSQSGEPTTDVSGASVTLTDLDPGGCAAPAVQLVETSSGVYQTTSLCPLAPGDRVALHVSTPDGAIIGARPAFRESAASTSGPERRPHSSRPRGSPWTAPATRCA